MIENWLPVIGYEGLYEVSDHGNVRSLDRSVKTGIRFNNTRIAKGRTLNKNLKHTGYFTVDLCKNGHVHTESVHRLVAKAFIPNPSNAKVVNHIDGVKTNNMVSNLEWVSYLENHWHARRNGLLTELGQYQNERIRCSEAGLDFINSHYAAQWLIDTKCPQIHKYPPNINTVQRNIRRAVNGGTPKAYGYHWYAV